jgi:uroporphyrin-III C-methyltransferase
MRHELRLLPSRAAPPGGCMTGKVYLIGAGPGDPELLTLKAVAALGRAEVVLVDELVGDGCLKHVRPGAKVLRVGKRSGCKSTPQTFIERLMVRLAKRGNVVARLKGGDPFVFGRGGEELLALRTAGIDVEAIPGITAGIGVPAEVGIPVTHRGIARAVTLLTGHSVDHDWQALRASGATLVIYMGIARLPELVARMLEGGFSPDTPACIVQDGTLATRRDVVAPLASLPMVGLKSPAIIVVGEVVRFYSKAERCMSRPPRTSQVQEKPEIGL